MYRYLESIKLIDGHFFRVALHQQRMNEVQQLFYPDKNKIDLDVYLKSIDFPLVGTYKCRLIYIDKILSVEFHPYTRKEINSLKLVESNISSSKYKYEDRKLLNFAFEKRDNCDDVLIAVNGLITDTWYCNVALYDENAWFTPANPLIYGVNRSDLIANGIVVEQDIEVNTLKNYTKIRLFNAMIEFGEIEMDISSIIL